jgi:predicted small integral membrane protein
MDWVILKELITIFGVLITFFGVLIFYFGRVILKSRKEITKDITSEILGGILFLIDSLIIPGLIIYVFIIYVLPFILYNQRIEQFDLIFIFIGGIIIFVQYKISEYYLGILKIQGSKTDRKINYLTSLLIIFSGLVFLLVKNWFYLILSLLLDFLIYTYMAGRDPFRNKDNNRDGQKLEIELLKGTKFFGEISRLGEDFIDFKIIGEKYEKSINKSQILSIKSA